MIQWGAIHVDVGMNLATLPQTELFLSSYHPLRHFIPSTFSTAHQDGPGRSRRMALGIDGAIDGMTHSRHSASKMELLIYPFFYVNGSSISGGSQPGIPRVESRESSNTADTAAYMLARGATARGVRWKR